VFGVVTGTTYALFIVYCLLLSFIVTAHHYEEFTVQIRHDVVLYSNFWPTTVLRIVLSIHRTHYLTIVVTSTTVACLKHRLFSR